MMQYLGPIRSRKDANIYETRARLAAQIASPVEKQRLLDAAALLSADRWRMVAARPDLGAEITTYIDNAPYPCPYCRRPLAKNSRCNCGS